MFTSARIQRFQSLHDVEVDLAPLTVIVGASNSGKSAFLRALRALVFNVNSPNVVTLGEKSTEIRLDREDKQWVTLERGKALSTYTLGSPESSEEYVKSGVSVPDPVSAFFRAPTTPDGEPYNFSFQFDNPFLLDTSGSKVAKVLGDLSNVTVLLDAAREANRRKLDVNGRLKIRKEDVQTAKERLKDYADLPAKKAALATAKEALDAAHADVTRYERLRYIVESLEASASGYRTLMGTLPAIPDDEIIADATNAVTRAYALFTTIQKIELEASLAKGAMADREALEESIHELEVQHHALLVESGACPTCGQEVSA